MCRAGSPVPVLSSAWAAPVRVTFVRSSSHRSQELQQLFGAASAQPAGQAAATPSALPKTTAAAKKPAKALVRRMPDHIVPPFIEANFRTMQFVLTRAPKLADFPRERMYRSESIDLLFRHYYKNRRS